MTDVNKIDAALKNQGAENTSVLLVEKKVMPAGTIEIWTLNRPDKLNAINRDVVLALKKETDRLWQELKKNLLSVRAVILTGAGEKAFAAGADISSMSGYGRAKAQLFSAEGQDAFAGFERLPVPTIAAISGFALGGGLEVAMCCDILIATEKSQFGQPEGQLGLIPGFGATARFLDRVGIAKGLELLFSARRIGAEEAKQLGLIQEVVKDKSIMDRAVELATECISKTAPHANRYVKQIAYEMRQDRFAKILDLESRSFGEIFETEDRKEGVAAFMEKRAAKFSGK